MRNSGTSMALIYDARVRALAFQAALILVLIIGAWWLINNTVSNLSEQGKTLGFNFLVQTAGFQISSTLGTWVMDYNVGQSTYLDVYFIGIINTFVVAVLGILAATVLGFGIGIMRLSNNLVLKGFATIYIEMLRNLPSRQFRYIRYQSLEPNAVNVAEVIFFDIQNKCAKFAADFQHLRVLHLLEQDSEALDCLTLDIIGLIVKAP